MWVTSVSVSLHAWSITRWTQRQFHFFSLNPCLTRIYNLDQLASKNYGAHKWKNHRYSVFTAFTDLKLPKEGHKST